MQAGLQTFYADGTLNIDTSTGIPRFLGITPSVFSGSVQVPEWATSRPWFVILKDQIGGPHQINPTHTTITGTTLAWSQAYHSQWGPPTIIYGCY